MSTGLNFGTVNGTVTIPASKSITQRAFAAALLHQGRTIVTGAGHSNDESAALAIIQCLGAAVLHSGEKVLISSAGQITPTGGTIDCGESGLAARLFTPIAALAHDVIHIGGAGSLPGRPMHFFTDVLAPLGVRFPGFQGHIPFAVQGPLKLRDIIVDGSLSSQFISGLLYAYTAAATQKVNISVSKLVSKPYIDLTLDMLSRFGKNITCNNYETFEIHPGTHLAGQTIEIAIEGDWSSAAFWIAAASISGSVLLKGLHPGSLQADRLILDIIQKAGAKAAWETAGLRIRAQELNAFEADLMDAPDLFPVLAVLAASSKGSSRLKGLSRLVHKESNRAEHIMTLLSLLKVSFSVEENTLIIKGREWFPGINYNNPNDHRMVMAAALASMQCIGTIQIQQPDAVNKSYPGFWNALSTSAAD